MNTQISLDTVKDMRTVDAMLKGGARFVAMDAATASGMALLTGELEKRDPKLREPLTSVTWRRDIVAKTGGGWVETTSTLNVSYATSGPNQSGIQGNQANSIPIVQADIGKDIYKVFSWANIMKVSFFDAKKASGIGRSLDDIYDKGIRLNFEKTTDQNVYQGFSEYGTYGLVNNPNVTVVSAPNGSGGSATWKLKTADEILYDVNKAINDGWAASEYDPSGIPNQILIPPAQYAYLVSQKVSTAGNVSILQFLLDNNIAKNQGVDLAIVPSRWCIGAGTGGTDRMVAYVNDEDKVYFDMTVPLSRVMTQPDVTNMAYLTAYAGQIGEVKFLYLQPPRYMDGI